MGNNIGGRRKGAKAVAEPVGLASPGRLPKFMAMEYFAQLKLRHCTKVIQLDGTAFRVKSPAYAGTVLREHPASSS
jgi:hypothetical protein